MEEFLEEGEGSRTMGAGPFVVGTSVVFSMVPGVPSNFCVARLIGSKMMLKKWGIFVLAVLISWL